MHWKPLDKIDTLLYKGMAILLIVTHNFMHKFPMPKQNEFAFHNDRFADFIYALQAEPENILRLILAYLGHFGVQIFIFLSAYGMTKKTLTQRVPYPVFIWDRVLKIYPSFILAILLWCLVTGWLNYGLLGPIKVLIWSLDSLLLKVTLLSVFTADEALTLVGPWWFISLIFQFYFVFFGLLNIYQRWGNRALLFLSLTSIAFTAFNQGTIGQVGLYYTVIGHLPEFAIGIYLAKNDHKAINLPILAIVLASIIFILGNVYRPLWYLNHVSMLILLLVLFTRLLPKLKQKTLVSKVLVFFGSISMPLFLVNGFMREPFITWAKNIDHWGLTIILCLLSLTASVICARLLSTLEKYCWTDKLKVWLNV
jgi:peptidoglycan/LPS O-acetylase OafA/YrhL